MIRFSICGAASYACGELLRLMVNHPETQVAHLADSFAAGRRIQDEHPALMGFYDQEILPLNDETIAQIVEDLLRCGRWDRVRHCGEGPGRRKEVHRLWRGYPLP